MLKNDLSIRPLHNPQPARFMRLEQYRRLVDNIKRYGCLTSAPFAVRRGDRYVILSGNHRVLAARNACACPDAGRTHQSDRYCPPRQLRSHGYARTQRNSHDEHHARPAARPNRNEPDTDSSAAHSADAATRPRPTVSATCAERRTLTHNQIQTDNNGSKGV